MKLWLLHQKVCRGYDTYDTCVVAAEDAASAKRIHPASMYRVLENWWKDYGSSGGSWPKQLKDISAEYIGEAREGHPVGVVCSSFNAG
jgi:hypothetical protein